MTRLKGSPYDTEPLLRPEGAAEMIGISVRTLNKWRIAGIGPAYVEAGIMGKSGAIRYTPSDLRRFIEDNTKPESRRAATIREKKAKLDAKLADLARAASDDGAALAAYASARCAPAPAVAVDDAPEPEERKQPRKVHVALPTRVYQGAKASADRLGIPVSDYIARVLEAFR